MTCQPQVNLAGTFPHQNTVTVIVAVVTEIKIGKEIAKGHIEARDIAMTLGKVRDNKKAAREAGLILGMMSLDFF